MGTFPHFLKLFAFVETVMKSIKNAAQWLSERKSINKTNGSDNIVKTKVIFDWFKNIHHLLLLLEDLSEY